jgi:hypothetical protein
VAFTDRTRLDDLQLAAEGRARAGSAAAAVLATPGDALFVLDGCPKLSGGTRLGGGVAERVESQLREGYERRAASQRHSLLWAKPTANAPPPSVEPRARLHVVAHYRAGALFDTPMDGATFLGRLLRDALDLRAADTPRTADDLQAAFDTERGGRLLPLRYTLQLLLAVQRELAGAPADYWLVSEAWPSWLEPLSEAIPGLQLITVPPAHGRSNVEGATAADGVEGGAAASAALMHLDVLSSADVLILGGGQRAAAAHPNPLPRIRIGRTPTRGRAPVRLRPLIGPAPARAQ